MTESISPGELRGLATFLCSIRDDWQPVPVRAALEKLQGYSLVDVAEVCTEIARNRSNQYPVMLSLKGEETIRAKSQQGGKRYSGGGKVPDEYKCDICGKARSICQSVPTNRGGRDHAFISAAQGDDERNQMHADGRMQAAVENARAEALERATGRMFALPADVTHPTHPEPQQEEAS